MKTGSKIPGAILIVILLSISIWLDSSRLFQTDVAVGIDGYYYVLQIDSLRENGYFYFPTNTPVILFFLTGLSLITQNTIIAIKIGALILQMFLYFGVGALVQTLTKNIWFAAIGIFLVSFSVLHLYYLSEFLSNLGALTFLIWGAFDVVKMVQSKNRIWFIFAGLLFLMSIFSHRSMFLLIASLFFVILLGYFWLNFATNAKHQIIFGLVFLALFMFPLILAWQSIIVLSEWVRSEVSQYAQNPFRPLVLMEAVLLSAICLLTIIFLVLKPKIVRETRTGWILLSLVTWNLLFILNPFLNHPVGISGIVPRLSSLAYIQAAIAVPLLFCSLLVYSKKFSFVVAAMMLPLLSLRWLAPFPVGLRTEYIKTREKLTRELPAMISKTCERPMIVAKHGNQFLVSAITGAASQRNLPIEQTYQCVFFLASDSAKDREYRSLPGEKITSLDGEVILVKHSNNP